MHSRNPADDKNTLPWQVAILVGDGRVGKKKHTRGATTNNKLTNGCLVCLYAEGTMPTAKSVMGDSPCEMQLTFNSMKSLGFEIPNSVQYMMLEL